MLRQFIKWLKSFRHKHVWIYYVSIRKRECHDCKAFEDIKDEAGQIKHKRRSQI